jgi:regulatory protein
VSETAGPDPLELALRALGRKERTVGELRAWLEARSCDAEGVEATLTQLIELGQLDDTRYVRRYAEDKRQLSGWGEDRIREALQARGLAADLIDAALDADSYGAQVERAIALLARRADSLADEPARARAFAYLARRGYPSEIAYEAVRRSARASAA